MSRMNSIIVFLMASELCICICMAFESKLENSVNDRILVGSTAHKSFWIHGPSTGPPQTDFLMARIYCHNANERPSLAAIENVEENDVFTKYFIESGSRSNYWTSGTNFGSLSPEPSRGTEWIWASTQNKVVYSNWIPCVTCTGRPHNKCINVSYGSSPGGNYQAYWYESDCGEPRKYVCQTIL